LEVRQAGRPDVIGTVDAVAAGDPNEPEIGARGESRGVQKAIDEAVAKAVYTFAPALVPRDSGDAGMLVAEIPMPAAATQLTRLKALQDLYPELSIAEMQALAQSRERFL